MRRFRSGSCEGGNSGRLISLPHWAWTSVASFSMPRGTDNLHKGESGLRFSVAVCSFLASSFPERDQMVVPAKVFVTFWGYVISS